VSDELALLQPRVALVGPPLANSGGIGRVMGYLLSALPAEAQPVVVLDTRGTSRHPALSGLTLLSVLLRLLLLRLRRCIDVVHVNISSHGSTMRKLPVVQLLHWLQIPCVLHLHASSYPEFYGTLSPWARRLVRRGFSLATRLIVLGEGWRIYAQNTLGVDPSRITVIPNALPGPASLDVQPRDGSTFHIVFLGRLGQRKGTGCLIDALAAMPDDVDWCATLAGDGDVDTYRRMAAARGIAERITFPG